MDQLSSSSSVAVGDGIKAQRGAWTFSGEVCKTFVPHIQRSVPLYEQGHDLVCKLSDFFVGPESTCYEIGVSTGELLEKLCRYNAGKPETRWIGVDVQKDMIAAAEEHCAGCQNVELVAEDVTRFDFQPSDFIVSYYCIQFIPPRERQQLINKLYKSLNWGGALVMFEKVRAPDARFQDIAQALYTDYKSDQGYSDVEILSKSRSLRGILEPFSSNANLGLLERAGFTDIWPVMKYICFEGFVAIK